MSVVGRKSKSDLKSMFAEAAEHHRFGRLAYAEVLYRQILAAAPRHFDAMHMLAVVAYQAGQTNDALELFEKADGLKPDQPPLLVNYGAALRKAGRLEDAIAVYTRALALKADLHEAMFNKAQCLFDLQRFEEAATFYRASLERRPDDADALASLGSSLRALGRWDEAFACFNQAIEKNPRSSYAYLSLARAYLSSDNVDTALAMFEKALEIDPRDGRIRTHHAFALLKLGRLEEGWKSYDGRFWYLEDRVPRRKVPPEYWAGEDLTGKSILVWTEQGVGDEVWYGSMMPDLIKLAAHVTLECQPRMQPVFARSFPTVNVVAWQVGQEHVAVSDPKMFDYQTAMGSLGRYLRPTLESFPQHSGFLKADQAKSDALRKKYGPGPLIGVSWKSSAKHTGELKSTTLSHWAPLLKIPGVRFVCLQYGDVRDELEAVKQTLGVEVISDPEVDSLKDMDAFFAQVAAMDLVVSTSNTTVHVAGSLNVPTWLLLPKGGGGLWYWFLARNDSPWYPSLRLFRQKSAVKSDENWCSEPIAAVAAEFQSWLTTRS